MEDTELNKAMRDLSKSLFRYKRYNAAVKLGDLPESSEVVIRVQAVAAALDNDVDARSAAVQTLQSPIHQAYLKNRPDFIREVTKSAVEDRERDRWIEEQNIRNEFMRRCTRQRLYSSYLLA